jgi:hypothetical protein
MRALAKTRLTGTSRLALTLGVVLTLLLAASCSRFKTMYLCIKGKAEDSNLSVDDAAKMAKGGKAGALKGAKGKLAGLTAEDGSPVDGSAGADGAGGSGGAAGAGSAGAAAGGADGTAGGTGAAAAGGSGAPGSAGGSGAPGSAAPGSFAAGTRVMAKRLNLMGEIAGDHVKMIKPSNDKIYFFYYEAGQRDVVEKIESGTDYDVTYVVRPSCPGESDACGDLVGVEEH